MRMARRSNTRPILQKRPHAEVTKTSLSTMGKIFVAILLIVVFEGALRKWVSSGLTNSLVLLRDGLLLYGLHWAIKHGKMRGFPMETQTLMIWSAIVLVWGGIQLIVNQGSLLVFIVGIRFWLLYLWFAYAAAISITENDFRYIVKTILWLLIFMVPLVIVQFLLPPSAFLNQQVDGDEADVFTVAAGIVRTTGTFSFTLGYTSFIAIATPFVLALLAPNTRFLAQTWTPKVMLLALGIATAVSGSRGSVIMFGVLFFFYLMVTMFFGKNKTGRYKAVNNQSMIGLTGMILVLIVVIYIFSDAIDATKTRFEDAADSENFVDRVVVIFTGEPGIYENFSYLGAGVGAGNNFAGVVATGERSFMLAESEAGRTILEAGLLGFAFIALKLGVLLLGLQKSVTIVNSTGNALPFLLWVTLAIALLTWSIVGQLTVNALGYLLFGLGVASLRMPQQKSI